MMQAFVINQDRENVKINISRIYSIKLTNKIRKLYDKLDVYDEEEKDPLVDKCGYLGIFRREKVQHEPMSIEKLA